MTRPPIILAVVLGFGVYDALAGSPSSPALEPAEAEEAEGWEFSLNNAVYVVRNDREYVNPTFTADRGALLWRRATIMKQLTRARSGRGGILARGKSWQ